VQRGLVVPQQDGVVPPEPTGRSRGAPHSTGSLAPAPASAPSAGGADAADNVPASIPTDEQKCPSCGREFKYRSNLIRHVRNIHQRRKDFSCDLCSPRRAFATTDSLRSHTRAVHELRRDFVCEFCTRAFSRKAHLRDHVALRHSGSGRPARRGRGRAVGRARASGEPAAALEGADEQPQAADGHPIATMRRQPRRAAASAVRYAELNGADSEDEALHAQQPGSPAGSGSQNRPADD
jgi:hypothetical protein